MPELARRRCRVLRPARAALGSDTGVALIEFAILAPLLILLVVNVFDFTVLIWASMQIDNAAQMGAQAAYHSCAIGAMPAMTNCGGLTSTVTTAVQSTSLGTGVSLATGYPTESYFCTSGTTLQSVGTYSSPPSPFDCTATGNPGVTPGDYIQVQVSYTYNPTFSGLSLLSSRTLTSQSLERLN